MIPFQCTELFQENSPFVKELTSDALSMWKMFGGDKINATSHWLSKEDIPQSTIESFALNCGKFHCGEKFIGVEIWTQFREADYSLADTAKAGLSFHFGKSTWLF